MKIEKLVITLAAIATMAACSIANAQVDKDYNIYVYEDCEQVKKIQMSEHQIKAYTELKQHEKLMEGFELPLQQMEQQLAVHEQELEALSGEMIIETADRMVVNKALVAKHTEIAHKMEKVVAEHRADIHELEQHARKIEQAAHEFERVIQPSLGKYKNKNIHIQIGNNSNWKCQA